MVRIEEKGYIMEREQLLDLVTILICFLSTGTGLFSANTKCLVLGGRAGAGKSTFCRYLKESVQESGYDLAFFTLRGMRVSNLSSFLSPNHPLNRWIAANHNRTKLLCVEELHRCGPTTVARLLHPLIDETPNLTIVFTTTFSHNQVRQEKNQNQNLLNQNL